MSCHNPVEEHSVTVITKIVLKIKRAFENCYYVVKYEYEGQEKYYKEYAMTKGWEVYRQDGHNARRNIDQLIALRKRILENLPILIICDYNPECDEYLTFCQTVLNGKSKINYADYLNSQGKCVSKHYSWEFNGASIVDAYTIPDDLLKDIFKSVICRNLRNRRQIQMLKTFKFDLIFKFVDEWSHQETITYINLEKLKSLFNLTTNDVTLICDFSDSRYGFIIEDYKTNYAPEIFSQLVRKRKQDQIEGESYVFDSDGTYFDIEILKKQKTDLGEVDSAGSLLFY
jgi:hypothetical protein